ncbi:MAG: hypothetical protein CL663_05730 [Bacteroidetes bacterium]|nr:hypothetical protein [Bacteroidota bacterium]|tara:strand:- start:106 stop:594 length:489 start_codon:yes stop_codon:yes gene_type:complete
MNTQPHKGLYRNSTQAIVGGVAAGIADNLNTDPTLIRILFIVLAIAGGGGVLIYCILWIALPSKSSPFANNPYTEADHLNKEGEPTVEYDQNLDSKLNEELSKMDQNKGSLIAGIVLISVGLIFLLSRIIPRIDFINFWPVLLLIVGVVMIIMGLKERENKS